MVTRTPFQREGISSASITFAMRSVVQPLFLRWLLSCTQKRPVRAILQSKVDNQSLPPFSHFMLFLGKKKHMKSRRWGTLPSQYRSGWCQQPRSPLLSLIAVLSTRHLPTPHPDTATHTPHRTQEAGQRNKVVCRTEHWIIPHRHHKWDLWPKSNVCCVRRTATALITRHIGDVWQCCTIIWCMICLFFEEIAD